MDFPSLLIKRVVGFRSVARQNKHGLVFVLIIHDCKALDKAPTQGSKVHCTETSRQAIHAWSPRCCVTPSRTFPAQPPKSRVAASTPAYPPTTTTTLASLIPLEIQHMVRAT